ncbi:hypothetical protein SAMN04487925_103215 [Bradyrhizobium sp. cf659]|nr:hypothetical protein SAMN04487925_103215 [Bradyrhizobium sp. cf659]
MYRRSRLILEGRSCVVTVASRACGGRGSVGRESCGQGGLLSVSPRPRARRAALSGSSRQQVSGSVDRARKTAAKWRAVRTAKPCGPGRRCYGQALAEAAVASTGAVPVNSAKAREARRNSAPGRARHKPSNHCAGCAVSSAHHLAQQTAGASRHPAFPAPSWLQRVERRSKTRAKSAARLRRRVCDYTLAVIAREGGRSSIPEAVVMEPRGCGVLDSPPSRGMTVPSGEPAHTSYSVIASVAKQSRLPPRKDSGLLRCARNDGIGGSCAPGTRTS